MVCTYVVTWFFFVLFCFLCVLVTGILYCSVQAGAFELTNHPNNKEHNNSVKDERKFGHIDFHSGQARSTPGRWGPTSRWAHYYHSKPLLIIINLTPKKMKWCGPGNVKTNPTYLLILWTTAGGIYMLLLWYRWALELERTAVASVDLTLAMANALAYNNI